MLVAWSLLFSSLLIGCNRHPDVILLSLDTLRVDHVSAFNSDSPAQTPFLDSVAKDGVIFTQAYSPISVTGPAFISLMTGQDIARHQVSMNVFRGGPSLPETEITLAELFVEKEYQTAAFLSGFTLHPNLGLSQGFLVYDGPRRTSRRWGDATAKKALTWLQKTPERRFLWYHTYDAHGPWTRFGSECAKRADDPETLSLLEHIPKYQRLQNCIDPEEYKARYAKAVQFADANVGLILDELKRQDRYDDALIVIVSDHGESFTERELWFDHGTSAHEEQLHVPLIIKYPRNKHAGTIDRRLVSLMDVAPTLVSEASLSPLPAAQGKSLTDRSYDGTPVLFGESSHCKNEKVLTCSPQGPRGKEFSLRNNSTAILLKGTDVFQYDRNTDLEEKSPQLANDTLKDELSSFATERRQQSMDLVWPPRQRTPDVNLLKKLGYVDEE